MSFKFGQIVATIENLEEQAALQNAEDDVAAQETATEVAEVNADTVQEEATIAQTDAAIAEAEAGEDKVEELTSIAEQSLAGEDEEVAEGEVGEEGEGLGEKEAALVEITHETILSSLGMTYQRPVTLTTESFADKASKRRATVATIEGLMDSAKKIGSGIIAALKAALNTVVNFLVGLVKNRTLMEKHLVNLAAKVKAIKSEQKPAKDKLTAGAGVLSVNGQASPETALKILTDAQALTAYAVSVSEAMNNGYDATVAAVRNVPANLNVSGNREVKIESNEDSVKLELASKGEVAKEIAAPTVAQMQQIVTAAQQALSKLREFEKTQNKLKSAVQNIISRLSEGYSKARGYIAEKTKNVDSFVKHNINAEVKKDARLTRTLMSKVGGTIPSAVFQAIKGAADYVTAGVNNYKAADAAPAEAKA